MTGGWYDHGLCRQYPHLVWFPPTRMKSTQCVDTKAVCARCPVKAECLHHAMTHPEISGIWGGLTEAERNKLHRTEARSDSAYRPAYR